MDVKERTGGFALPRDSPLCLLVCDVFVFPVLKNGLPSEALANGLPSEALAKDGGPGWTRTSDPTLIKRVL